MNVVSDELLYCVVVFGHCVSIRHNLKKLTVVLTGLRTILLMLVVTGEH